MGWRATLFDTADYIWVAASQETWWLKKMSVQEDYLQLLDLAYEVAQSLKGKRAENPYEPDCQKLAAKLWFHAATIYQLCQGTRIPVPYSTRGSDFRDFPSAIVLARAVLETYLTMFEVFFEPDNDDEREFRHALWQLSGFVIREEWVATRTQSQVAGQIEEIQKMRDCLQDTKKFSSLKPGEQREVLKGKRKRDWVSTAQAAGFGKQTIRLIYRYQSGYVHADGLSGAQIISLQTPQQIEFIESQMHIVMIVLSKMIYQYAEKFPEARAICAGNPDAFHKAKVWSGAAEILP